MDPFYRRPTCDKPALPYRPNSHVIALISCLELSLRFLFNHLHTYTPLHIHLYTYKTHIHKPYIHTMTVNILILGATRGLGSALLQHHAAQPSTIVWGTTRSSHAPLITFDETSGKYGGENAHKVNWVTDIDVSIEGCGTRLVNRLGSLGMGGGMVSGGIGVFDIVVRYHHSESSIPKEKKRNHVY